MSVWSKLRQSLSTLIATPAMRDHYRDSVRQSVAGQDFRFISDKLNDLPAADHQRHLQVCSYLARKCGPAKRALEIIIDFAIGTGMTFRTFDNPVLESWLKRHWNDGLNHWDIKQYARFLSLEKNGELLMPIFIGDDGVVRLGRLSPKLIEKVITSNEDSDVVLEVHVRDQYGSGVKRYAVVRRDTMTGRFSRMVNRVQGQDGREALQYPDSVEQVGIKCDGICFFRQINKDEEQARGISELWAAADFLDACDFGAGQAVTRLVQLNKFVWDVEIPSDNKDIIKAYAEQLEAEPKTATSTRVHGPKTKWEAVAPDLGSTDITTILKYILNYALGAMGIPEHWYSEGSNENLATAKTMGQPVLRRLMRKQQIYREIIKDVLEYQRDYLVQMNLLTDQNPQSFRGHGTGDDKMRIEVTAPSLTEPTEKDIVELLSSLTASLTVMIDNGWLDDEKAKMLVERYVTQLGVDVDTETVGATGSDAQKFREDREGRDWLDDDPEITERDVAGVRDRYRRGATAGAERAA